jgi:hypothetical protein
MTSPHPDAVAVAGAEGACSELRDLWDQAVIDYNAALAPAPED